MMKLKGLLLNIVALVAVVTSVGCGPNNRDQYEIVFEKRAVCSHIGQTIEIEYLVHSDIMNSKTKFSATSSEDWLKVADTSTIGKIKLVVEENIGDSRSATITLSAPGCVTTSTTLLQYGIPPEKANHTLMFYFFGTSLSRFFKTNLEDAATAIETGILGNANRVVFFRQEGKNSGYIGELCYDIDGGECIEQRIENITLPSSIITPEKIGEHISMMASYAPAERYGIVFAGHGQGWITREILNNNKDVSALSAGYNPWIPAAGAEVTRAFGENNVQVNIDELAMGIESSGIALDYILFDACFMSNIEAIYELRNAANYIIASPCEIMGKGFPYHRTLPHLFTNDGATTDYVAAAESYNKYYKDEYVGGSRCGSIAVYQCSEIENLATATSAIMASAKSDYDTKGLQTYEGQNPHHFYDFGQWVNVVATDSSALATFNEAMDRCVVATYTLSTFYSAYGQSGSYPINLDVYSGVTTSAPSEAYPNGWRQTNWYKDVIALEN